MRCTDMGWRCWLWKLGSNEIGYAVAPGVGDSGASEHRPEPTPATFEQTSLSGNGGRWSPHAFL
jgi:hypothetical protein